MDTVKLLTEDQTDLLMTVLHGRFENHMHRHDQLLWSTVAERLAACPEKLWILHEMENSGGEPDVLGTLDDEGLVRYYDCSMQSPAGRRSLCYDQKALDSRKANKPKGNAVTIASAMGITLLTESDYRYLQTFGPFDTKTSSWILAPQSVRELGGALFCDYRYGQMFTYHNGAESYYAARGFRGWIAI